MSVACVSVRLRATKIINTSRRRVRNSESFGNISLIFLGLLARGATRVLCAIRCTRATLCYVTRSIPIRSYQSSDFRSFMPSPSPPRPLLRCAPSFVLAPFQCVVRFLLPLSQSSASFPPARVQKCYDIRQVPSSLGLVRRKRFISARCYAP